MNAEDLTLNIAVNLGRVSRWAQEGKVTRINQFLEETQKFLSLLEKTPRKARFEKTFSTFKKNFQKLKAEKEYSDIWAENALTWANILSHRAKLA